MVGEGAWALLVSACFQEWRSASRSAAVARCSASRRSDTDCKGVEVGHMDGGWWMKALERCWYMMPATQVVASYMLPPLPS